MPIPEADPSRLFAVGRLFGVPVPERWRVLEVGCGAGGHLVPLSARHPDDVWVGFDRATLPIQQARGLADKLGAPVTLQQLDLLDAPDALSRAELPEAYDLIIAHGVYSWVPDAAREALWRLLARWLAPGGMAYLSVNCLPGWGLRGTLGGMLRFVAGDGPPDEQIGRARAFVNLLAELVPASDPYGAWLRREQRLVAQQGDSWVFHDLLAPTNEPVWLHEMVARAATHGLQYVGDAKLTAMLPDRLPAEAQARIASLGGSQVQQEQLLDFVVARSFRRVLLCRDDLPLSRDLGTDALRGMWARGQLVGEGKGRFRSLEGDELSTESPLLQDIFGELVRRRPGSVAIDELVARAPDDAARVRQNLLLAASRGLLELRVRGDGLVGAPGVRPVAEGVAAVLAAQGEVPSALGQRVRLDELGIRLLPLLDGTRDVATLVRTLIDDGFHLQQRGAGAVTPDALRGWLEVEVPQRLRSMARAGLLVG